MDGIGTHETASFGTRFVVVVVLNPENVARICMKPAEVSFGNQYVEIIGHEYYIGVITLVYLGLISDGLSSEF